MPDSVTPPVVKLFEPPRPKPLGLLSALLRAIMNGDSNLIELLRGQDIQMNNRLWIMRIGTKLAIFSGALKLSTDIMPQRLSYLKSYFRNDHIGWGYWLSLCLCSVFFGLGLYVLQTINYGQIDQTKIVILTAIVSLALLENIFMALPIADSKLWSWAMGNKTTRKNETQTRIASE